MKNSKSKSIKPAVLLLSLVLFFNQAAWAAETDARSISIFSIEGGDVKMTKGTAKEFAAKEGYQLNDGYTVSTGSDSFCYLQMDTDSILKMDERSRIAVSKKSKTKLSVTVQSGGALVDAGEQLEGNTLETRVGNTGLTVRGTVYVIGQTDGGVAVTMLEGEGDVDGNILPAGAVMNIRDSGGTNGKTYDVTNEISPDEADLFTAQTMLEYSGMLLEEGFLTREQVETLPEIIERKTVNNDIDKRLEEEKAQEVEAEENVTQQNPVPTPRPIPTPVPIAQVSQAPAPTPAPYTPPPYDYYPTPTPPTPTPPTPTPPTETPPTDTPPTETPPTETPPTETPPTETPPTETPPTETPPTETPPTETPPTDTPPTDIPPTDTPPTETPPTDTPPTDTPPTDTPPTDTPPSETPPPSPAPANLVMTLISREGNTVTPLSGERTTSFTVAVSGFISGEDATNIGLAISPINGFEITGHDSAGGISSLIKTFTVNVNYIDESVPAHSEIYIAITGLTNLPADGSAVYEGVGMAVPVQVRDGASPLTAIPIENASDLLAFNNYAQTAQGLKRHYAQTADITLNLPSDSSPMGNWRPVGFVDAPFTGSYNGGTKTISGLVLKRDGGYPNKGFFACVSGTVQDLGLIDVSIEGNMLAMGSIAAYNKGSIIRCYATGEVINSDSGGSFLYTDEDGGKTGGLVGSNEGTVSNCYFEGSVSGYYRVGGLAGQNRGSGSVIENSYTNAAVTGLNSYAGGIVGSNQGSVRNCYTASGSTLEGMGNANMFGGIAGVNTNIVEYCYARNGIGFEYSEAMTPSMVGGIVGSNEGAYSVVRNCVALNPFMMANSYAGYVVGNNNIDPSESPKPEKTYNNYAHVAEGTVDFTLPGHADTNGMYYPNYEIEFNNVYTNVTRAAFWLNGTVDWAANMMAGSTYDGPPVPHFKAAWNSAIWNIRDGYLPILNGMPPGIQNAVLE